MCIKQEAGETDAPACFKEKFQGKLISQKQVQKEDSSWEQFVFVRCMYQLSYLKPSCLQTTVASLSVQPSSQMLPHCPFRNTSTRPSLVLSPSTSRTGGPVKEKTQGLLQAKIPKSMRCPELSFYRKNRGDEEEVRRRRVVIYLTAMSLISFPCKIGAY